MKKEISLTTTVLRDEWNAAAASYQMPLFATADRKNESLPLYSEKALHSNKVGTWKELLVKSELIRMGFDLFADDGRINHCDGVIQMPWNRKTLVRYEVKSKSTKADVNKDECDIVMVVDGGGNVMYYPHHAEWRRLFP